MVYIVHISLINTCIIQVFVFNKLYSNLQFITHTHININIYIYRNIPIIYIVYVFMYIIVYVSLLLRIQVKLQEYNIWKITFN